MLDRIDRPDTRLHPSNASEAQFATCNAGAIHKTGRKHPDVVVHLGTDRPRKHSSGGAVRLRQDHAGFGKQPLGIGMLRGLGDPVLVNDRTATVLLERPVAGQAA